MSAAADWAADKTIALPDWRGNGLAFLDDMGSSAAGRLTSGFFGTDATILGAAGGSEKHQLTQAQLPAFDMSATTSTESAVHVHEHAQPQFKNVQTNNGPLGTGWAGESVVTDTSQEKSLHTHAVTVSSGGGNASHNNVQPTKLATLYIKL